MIPPKVIAEIGCNHKGEMSIAKQMVSVAASFCNVDVVKFQKRSPAELLSAQQYSAPHPNPAQSYGDTYGAHREALEFTIDQHKQLLEWCQENNVIYSTSVWDLTSAKEIAELNPVLIKIPSATNLRFDVLGHLCDHYGGEIHLSFGMTNHQEEEQIVDFFVQRQRVKDVVIYSCTSGYPVAFEDVCLLEIPRLKKTFGETVKHIGFSGHHLGVAVDIAAMTLGAEWVERHFTLDRTWKGTDHAASLEPDGLRRLTRDLRNVAKSIEAKSMEVLPVEQTQRDKLKSVLSPVA